MARTAYCKRCGKEVEAGEMCPFCGTRLGKNAAHAAWCVERTPVRDWMYWNSVMRLLLPGVLVIVVLVLAAEWIAGGPDATEKLLSSAFLPALGILLAAVLLTVFLVLLLQGKELSDLVVDSRGVRETRYLPDPSPLKLILRGKAPRPAENGENRILQLSERRIAWKDISRVQLWPEKCMALIYAPSWWLRIPVVCTPFSWEDTMEYIREKLGKKKSVRLPKILRVQAPSVRRNSRNTAPAEWEPEVFQAPAAEAGWPAEAADADTADAKSTDPLT